MASRFVLAEFTDENYQVVWRIMAKLCVVVAVLVAFVAGPEWLVEAFLDVAPNPNRARRPPDHEVVEHGDGQREVHPRI